MKTYHFLSGLPRSGSTLLASILNQNTTLYATTTSPLLDLLYLNEQSLRSNPSYIANPNQDQIVSLSKAIIDGCWKHIPQSIIIDKHRAHARNIPAIKHIITPNPKVLVTARDIPSVIASFILLIRKNDQETFVDTALRNRNIPINDANRADLLWNEYISDPYMSFKQSFETNRNNIHIIEYDDLITNPDQEINKVYGFLELPSYNHDYNNIQNKTKDDDLVAWGMDGLHTIRKQLQKTSSHPKDVLGDVIYSKYTHMNLEFWRTK